MMRPEFEIEKGDNPWAGREKGFHQPPGAMGARVERGRIGPKYESWSGSVQTNKPQLRNCARTRPAAAPLLPASAASSPWRFPSSLSRPSDRRHRLADADNEKTLHIP